MRSFSAIGIVVLLSLFVFSVSCGSQAPVLVPTSPLVPTTPQTPPASKWVADGIVNRGEYTGTETHGDYEIHWASDGENVYIAMKAKTSGWVAMAVQPGSRMKNADIVLGFVKDGKASVHDLFSTGDYGPHPLDIELGGTSDVLEFGGMEEGGYTIIEFKRALNTGDQYDKPLANGVNKIIWSYGSDDSLTPKHINRGYGELVL